MGKLYDLLSLTTPPPVPEPNLHPEYLGDGVYATFDGYNICLSLGSHDDEPVVYLDPSVMKALQAYARKVPQLPCQKRHYTGEHK